jgi:hypothetical protein
LNSQSGWQWPPHHPVSGDCRSCHAAEPFTAYPFHPEWQKRPFGPEQACGAPDTPGAGDHPTAWASATSDRQDEWLELSYAEDIAPVAVEIHETFNPGAVARVLAFDAGGGEVELWKGTETVPSGAQAWTYVLPVEGAAPTRRIRIDLASMRVAGWNEIDAVGLRDATGRLHWAREAKASSTYASVAGRVDLHPWPPPGVHPTPDLLHLQRQLAAAQQRLVAALQRIEELERRFAGRK